MSTRGRITRSRWSSPIERNQQPDGERGSSASCVRTTFVYAQAKDYAQSASHSARDRQRTSPTPSERTCATSFSPLGASYAPVPGTRTSTTTSDMRIGLPRGSRLRRTRTQRPSSPGQDVGRRRPAARSKRRDAICRIDASARERTGLRERAARPDERRRLYRRLRTRESVRRQRHAVSARTSQRSTLGRLLPFSAQREVVARANDLGRARSRPRSASYRSAA